MPEEEPVSDANRLIVEFRLQKDHIRRLETEREELKNMLQENQALLRTLREQLSKETENNKIKEIEVVVNMSIYD